MRNLKASLSTKYLLFLLLSYSASVFAVPQEAILTETGPFDIPWVNYGYVLLMAAWGASAALFQRFAGGEVPRWKWVIARDITNATLAAILVFLFCEYQNIPAPIKAIASTLAAYGGARFMEFLYGRLVSAANYSTRNYTGSYNPAPPNYNQEQNNGSQGDTGEPEGDEDADTIGQTNIPTKGE